MTSCSLQKLLADLGVNVILVTMLDKHFSYTCIYYLDSYCFNFEFSKGGQNVFNGGGGGRMPTPPKRNPDYTMVQTLEK